MALNAAQQWWVRTDGAELNGGGYDATISGAGVNYSDQAAAQLALTDVVTTGTTAVSSVTGGFTSAMIGNIIRIAGDGYYAITSRTSTNLIGVDRATGTATGQSARIGGAFATIWDVFANSGPILATPLDAGHTINLRGTGGSDPITPDYVTTTFNSYPNGATFLGDTKISVIGYNGRPCIGNNVLTFYQMSQWHFQSIKFLATGASNNPSLGFIHAVSNALCEMQDCIFDQAGYDVALAVNATGLESCTIKNSGSPSSGSYAAVTLSEYGSRVLACLFSNVIGWAVDATTLSGHIINNVFASCHNASHAMVEIGSAATYYQGLVYGNTFDSGASDGLKFIDTTALCSTSVINNIFSNNGGFGLNCAAGTADANDRIKRIVDYNDFYLNTSGARNNISAGANDLTLDPQYTNAAANDFSIGTNLKAKGYPSQIGAVAGTASFVDIGAAQRPEGSSGGSSMSAQIFGG